MARATVLAVVAGLSCLVTACSSSSAGSGGGGTDPLIGTWFSQVTPVSADNQTATLTFNADKSYTAVHTQVDPAASTTPGCTETNSDRGTFAEGGSSGALTVTFTPDPAASGQLVKSGCTNATDDGSSTGSPNLTGASTYSVSGNTLTLQGAGTTDATVFTRS